MTNEPKKYPREFERISKNAHDYRLRVPHGWIVYLGGTHECAAVFYQDEKHEWVLEEEE
jgi:hypothetical protein